MKVTLIDYTGCCSADPSDYAASVLIFTKNTRLKMSPDGLQDILAWPWGKKETELRYMANTIPSSHEFCHYTFMIEGVTRAFTHQFVRTRTASYAQQSLRVIDVNGWDYGTGPTIDSEDGRRHDYDAVMTVISSAYNELIEDGAAIEDARGILPTNILTNIVMGCNLRTMVELVQKRSSPRVQGEYRAVLDAMKTAVKEVHPWVSLFIDRTFDRAAADLDNEIAEIEDPIKRGRMVKLTDQLRAKQ